MKYIFDNGGMVITHRDRGTAIAHKIAAYVLHERGLDTIEANQQLHLTINSKEWDAAANIFTERGIASMQL